MSFNSKRVKALLLSAGIGSRLRPLTYKIPKCLVKINGIPILEFWLRKLENLGVDSVIVNLHYLADQVHDFLAQRQSKSIIIHEVYEHTLLGTAGSLLNNSYLLSNSTILLIHSDNYTKGELDGLIKAHLNRPTNCLITMLTFYTRSPSECGIVTIDSRGIVNGFYEKVANPPGNIANGAIYVFDSTLIDWILARKPNAFDFSIDVLPMLIGKIYTFHLDEKFIDIGTPGSLIEAQKF